MLDFGITIGRRHVAGQNFLLRETANRLPIWISKHGALQPNASFGGAKGSGFGVKLGKKGPMEIADFQVVFE